MLGITLAGKQIQCDMFLFGRNINEVENKTLWQNSISNYSFLGYERRDTRDLK